MFRSALLLSLLFLASTVAGSEIRVPFINFEMSCRAAVKASAGIAQSIDACRRSEEEARETLRKQWTSFAGPDRQSCYRLTTTGTSGTYTELLTCLEMRRDAGSKGRSNVIRSRG